MTTIQLPGHMSGQGFTTEDSIKRADGELNDQDHD
jgi:hypothetical protein